MAETPLYFANPFAVNGDVAPISMGSVPPTMSYSDGFTSAYELPLTNPSALPIPRTQFNQLMLDITTAIQQYQQLGVFTWITSTQNLGTPFPYALYARCRYDDGSGIKTYESLQAANTQTPGVGASQWRIVSSPELPVGSLIDYAGAISGTPPALPNYLNCDGTPISRTTYAALFAAIGTVWGAGDGSTTFNLPNLLRRTTIGVGGTGTTIIQAALGSIGGAESVAIEQGNLPAGILQGQLGITTSAAGGSGTLQSNQPSPPGTMANASFNLGGSGDSLNIIQPSAVVYKLIKYA
jgi:microcystin-dependent protein